LAKFDRKLIIKPMRKYWVVACLIACVLNLSAQSNYRIVRKISLPGNGFWDYITVDETNGRIFQSHNSMVQVVDIKTGKLVGTIPNTKGVHGAALAPDLNKGFTSNGQDSSVTVFNLKTLEVITKIRVTGRNPDAILYDAFSKRVFTGNGRSRSFTVIDAVNNSVAGTISLSGKPEAIVNDGKGKIFVNIETANLIEVIDAASMKVIAHWPIGPGMEPSGLALDNENHRLFSVCSNKLMIVLDANSGKVITSLPIGEGCDGAAFDPQYKRAYASNGEGTLTVVQVLDANTFKVIETVPTQRGARTIALDKTSHHIYLPTAEFEAAPEGQRPGIKPDTFVILDVESDK
jgi:YVTN family beta-propeller protein